MKALLSPRIKYQDLECALKAKAATKVFHKNEAALYSSQLWKIAKKK